MTNQNAYIGYRITHKTSGRYYIGVVKAYMWDNKAHARTCPHKGDMPATPYYMGSGVAIREAILEHGAEAFDREILARLDNWQQADVWERANVIMQEDDPLSYNINGGGKASFKTGKASREKITGKNNPRYGVAPVNYIHGVARTPSGMIKKRDGKVIADITPYSERPRPKPKNNKPKMQADIIYFPKRCPSPSAPFLASPRFWERMAKQGKLHDPQNPQSDENKERFFASPHCKEYIR